MNKTLEFYLINTSDLSLNLILFEINSKRKKKFLITSGINYTSNLNFFDINEMIRLYS